MADSESKEILEGKRSASVKVFKAISALILIIAFLGAIAFVSFNWAFSALVHTRAENAQLKEKNAIVPKKAITKIKAEIAFKTFTVAERLPSKISLLSISCILFENYISFLTFFAVYISKSRH